MSPLQQTNTEGYMDLAENKKMQNEDSGKELVHNANPIKCNLPSDVLTNPPSYYDQAGFYRAVPVLYPQNARYGSYDSPYACLNPYQQNYDLCNNYHNLYNSYDTGTGQPLQTVNFDSDVINSGRQANYLHSGRSTTYIDSSYQAYGKHDSTRSGLSPVKLHDSFMKNSFPRRKCMTLVDGYDTEFTNKRVRMTYSKNQIDTLEREFNNCNFVHRQKRTDLASRLDLTERQVKIWFQNRRMKKKKESLRSSLGSDFSQDVEAKNIEDEH